MIKNMSKEELEILSYTDLAELILKENNSSFNTANLFKQICDLLEYSEEDYAEKIGDFYTSLTTDKRFAFLDNNEWDLREKHPVSIILDAEDEDDIEEEDEDDIEEDDIEEENIDSVIEDEELDDTEEDLEDLAIITEEELEEN